MSLSASLRAAALLLLICLLPPPAQAAGGSKPAPKTWWNAEWTIRKQVTVDPADVVTEPLAGAVVLVRLHEGNFAFGSVREDGSDLRVIAADDKTPLPFHLEKIDPLMNEAFLWVKVGELKPGAPVSFWIYYGNSGPGGGTAVADAKATYDAETLAVYHFAEHGAAPVDASTNANHAAAAGVFADGTIIGTGLRLDGRTLVRLPASPSLKWEPGATLTWSAWVKLAAVPPQGILFSRRDGASGLVIGADAGVPFVEVSAAGGTQRTPAGEALTPGVWRHWAVVASAGKVTLYLDGAVYGTLEAALPALNTEAVLGGEAPGAPEGRVALTGELDELQLARVARPLSWLKLAARAQGATEQAGKLVAVGNDEESGHGGEGELAKHVQLISDISRDLTLDGWIVIYLCGLLAVIGAIITVWKFIYLTRISKATGAFLKQWEKLSTNLHVLDHGDEKTIKSMGGTASPKLQKVLRQSPLYHLYQIGFAEIQQRASNARAEFRGLSGRSMEAIKATLDGGLVREVQRLNSQLVFLTIGIAGGPYLGLLGTVIGVMITFAVIAKSGEVEVNSIAPGIAGALLATVAGLAVAIPCLFAYSYISTRIKDAVSDMQVFIDEFVAKLAETYPEVD